MDKTFPADPVLVVDDEENACASVKATLTIAGMDNVLTCSDSRTVEGLLAERAYSLVLLDLLMPHVSGAALLPRILAADPDLPVIVMTAAGDVETAVTLMRAGAFDFLVKPVDRVRMVASARNAIDRAEMRRENVQLKEHLLSGTLKNPAPFAPIITHSEAMLSIFRYVESIAATALPVLVTGETGSGKELVARAIHDASGRTGAFVPVNVAGLDDTLFSDALFGHLKGAFTGATQDRQGMIARAAAGTLFLDEIGDLAMESQIKLLRLLQDREYLPLGSDKARKSDTRFVFATNSDLEKAASAGRFRRDLFFRLRSHHIRIPALRERQSDIPVLLDFFLHRAAQHLGKSKPTVPRELPTFLCLYGFPGNVRELEGLVYDAMVRHESGILSLDSFRNATGGNTFSAAPSPSESAADENETARLFAQLQNLPTMKAALSSLVEEALKRAHGNQAIAARILGTSRTALNKRLKKEERGEP